MLSDVLAKSRPSKRVKSVGGVFSEHFDGAVRSLHNPLTPELVFENMSDFVTKLQLLVKNMGRGKIQTLSIHGHGATYGNGVGLEMGDDTLHVSTLKKLLPSFKSIGKLMDPDGEIKFLHCFAGSAGQIMPDIAKAAGCKVSGEIKLNGLSPVLVPIQNWVMVEKSGSSEKKVGAGRKTYSPNGGTTLVK